jgi:hypothetical protein
MRWIGTVIDRDNCSGECHYNLARYTKQDLNAKMMKQALYVKQFVEKNSTDLVSNENSTWKKIRAVSSSDFPCICTNIIKETRKRCMGDCSREFFMCRGCTGSKKKKMNDGIEQMVQYLIDKIEVSCGEDAADEAYAAYLGYMNQPPNKLIKPCERITSYFMPS